MEVPCPRLEYNVCGTIFVVLATPAEVTLVLVKGHSHKIFQESDNLKTFVTETDASKKPEVKNLRTRSLQ
jgi:hypothetical protein